MNTATLDPRISELETEERARSYDHWLCGKVQEAIDDKRPGVAHDQVMAEMEAIIAEVECSRNASAFRFFACRMPGRSIRRKN